jgi:hypothetical protein
VGVETIQNDEAEAAWARADIGGAVGGHRPERTLVICSLVTVVVTTGKESETMTLGPSALHLYIRHPLLLTSLPLASSHTSSNRFESYDSNASRVVTSMHP